MRVETGMMSRLQLLYLYSDVDNIFSNHHDSQGLEIIGIAEQDEYLIRKVYLDFKELRDLKVLVLDSSKGIMTSPLFQIHWKNFPGRINRTRLTQWICIRFQLGQVSENLYYMSRPRLSVM